MDYITIKRARFKSISGPVNLPYGTEVQCIGGIMYVGGYPDSYALCCDHSQNAYAFFAKNDDGQGLERGSLTQAICKMLEKRDADYQARWDKIWTDTICQKYKRKDHKDFWLWNHDFFNANLTDLRHIAALIGVKIEGGKGR